MKQIPMAAARKARGLTQKELAKEMGVSRQTILDWENGKRPIKTAYFYLFCKITGFTEEDILLP